VANESSNHEPGEQNLDSLKKQRIARDHGDRWSLHGRSDVQIGWTEQELLTLD